MKGKKSSSLPLEKKERWEAAARGVSRLKQLIKPLLDCCLFSFSLFGRGWKLKADSWGVAGFIDILGFKSKCGDDGISTISCCFLLGKVKGGKV